LCASVSQTNIFNNKVIKNLSGWVVSISHDGIIVAIGAYRGNQNVIELLNLRSTIYFEDLLKFV